MVTGIAIVKNCVVTEDVQSTQHVLVGNVDVHKVTMATVIYNVIPWTSVMGDTAVNTPPVCMGDVFALLDMWATAIARVKLFVGVRNVAIMLNVTTTSVSVGMDFTVHQPYAVNLFRLVAGRHV